MSATRFDLLRQILKARLVPVVRSASLAGFADLVRELGGRPETLARHAGVPLDALRSLDIAVPLEAMGVALELAAERLRCPDFGLRLGDRQQLESLGPLAVAIRHSPHLGDALDCARRFLTLHNQGSTLRLEDDPHEVRGVAGLRFAWHHEGRAYPQSMDKILLNVHRVIESLAGPDYGLRSVELSYRPAAPAARHAALFGGVRVNLDRPLTMLRLPRELLERPVVGAETAVRDMAVYYLTGQVAPAELNTTVAVRAALDALLGTGRTTPNWVARHLETTSRTLQRRLQGEGTTFQAILDQVRRETCSHLLAETTLPLAEVAAMLDLADQATLSRMARRWWDTTPSQKRREHSRCDP